MKKYIINIVLVMFLINCLVAIFAADTKMTDINIENININSNMIPKNYNAGLKNKDGYKNIYLGANDNTNVFKEFKLTDAELKEESLVKEQLKSYGDLNYKFMDIDNTYQLNVNLKNPKIKLEYKFCIDYIVYVVLHNKKTNEDKLLWYYYRVTTLPHRNVIPVKIIDMILSKDFKRLVILYEDEMESYFINVVNVDKKVIIGEMLPISSSNHVYSREIKDARIWSNNSVKYTFKDGSIEHYKIFQTMYDVGKNKEKYNKKNIKNESYNSPSLIFWNNNGADRDPSGKICDSFTEMGNIKSWDYNNIEPKFSLDPIKWYFRKIKTN